MSGKSHHTRVCVTILWFFALTKFLFLLQAVASLNGQPVGSYTYHPNLSNPTDPIINHGSCCQFWKLLLRECFSNKLCTPFFFIIYFSYLVHQKTSNIVKSTSLSKWIYMCLSTFPQPFSSRPSQAWLTLSFHFPHQELFVRKITIKT